MALGVLLEGALASAMGVGAGAEAGLVCVTAASEAASSVLQEGGEHAGAQETHEHTIHHPSVRGRAFDRAAPFWDRRGT